jgi:alkylation response protein AidB-like acyl-CoA dehydrogenase
MPMTSRLVPRRDLDFMLVELLARDRLCERERFAEHSRETFAAALDSAYQIAAERFAPHYQEGDAHEPHVADGKVVLIPQAGEAVRAFADAGFIAAAQDLSLGGMQLPFSVAMACWGVFKSANIATETYASLTIGAANLVREFGTPAQVERYLPPMLAGRWLGTMVLTEPQAGSSLGDIRATATPLANGTYSLRGQKIFITAGDHEITENIVHLVLARLPDSPPGTKGISLFVVPKRRVNADGSVGESNDVALAGLIHKMGSRGCTSTSLSFGENGNCIGELVGQPHQGLACMFRMMNEARVNVGMCASMLGVTGYQHAVAYARERVQGRDASGKPAAIIEHADVKRMLLAQKAAAEGALALTLYGASLSDEADTAPRETARSEARALLELLTPVIKSWPSKYCTEANAEAIQVHGGYGYTRDYPVEQIYRDNRLNAIHEGTHGVQSLDLLGRKVLADGGRALEALGREMGASAEEARASGRGELHLFADGLYNAFTALHGTTQTLAAAMQRDPQQALANSAVYLDTFGHTVVAWLWLRQAVVAAAALDAGTGDTAFYEGKLAAARYCFGWMLPTTQASHALLRRLDNTCAAVRSDWF